MSYYVMVGEGVYPAARIATTHRNHLENDLWIDGEPITFEVPEPIYYDLDSKHPGNLKLLYDSAPIPVMHKSLLDVLADCGVNNIQIYDAVILDLENNIEYTDYRSFNITETISAADIKKSEFMGTSENTMIDADFDRLVIDENKCIGRLLFRLAENITAIVVHERIKNEVEKRGLKGILFYPNGQWSG